MILYQSPLPNCYHLVLIVGIWSLQKWKIFGFGDVGASPNEAMTH